METSKLEPCPFCGSENVGHMTLPISHYVECLNCGARGPTRPNAHAIEDWNDVFLRDGRMRAALERIVKWFGQFPPTGKFHENGSPTSYGYEYGSNGERDFMRKVAQDALRPSPSAVIVDKEVK